MVANRLESEEEEEEERSIPFSSSLLLSNLELSDTQSL